MLERFEFWFSDISRELSKSLIFHGILLTTFAFVPINFSQDFLLKDPLLQTIYRLNTIIE